jgi:hypothetical protein
MGEIDVEFLKSVALQMLRRSSRIPRSLAGGGSWHAMVME